MNFVIIGANNLIKVIGKLIEFFKVIKVGETENNGESHFLVIFKNKYKYRHFNRIP